MRRFNQTNKAFRAGNSSLADRFGSTSPSPPPPAATAKQNTTQSAHIAQEENEKQVDKDGQEEEEEEEEDDYMSMTFADAPTAPETSLQRRERLKKEGLKRGRVPSKAELAAQERARREEGLSRPLIPLPPAPTPTTTTTTITTSTSTGTTAAATAKSDTRSAAALAAAAAKKSKGLAMMAKMGFRPGTSLGATGEARAEPLPIEVREDRGGVGLDGERKRRLREAAMAAGEMDEEGNSTSKRPRVDEGDYRARMARERDAARKEKLVRAAQKIAERMDEDGRREGAEGGEGKEALDGGEGGGGERKEEGKKATKKTSHSASSSSRPLRSLPVLYRGLVRDREAAERDRRMRHDMEVSVGALSSARLPTYEDETMDADDRLAMGVGGGGGEGEMAKEGEGEENDEGKNKEKNGRVVTEVVADDLDDEDAELEAFEALEVDERLGRLVGYLRARYRYCFWCKFAYPDEGMEGCPGTTEEDHD